MIIGRRNRSKAKVLLVLFEKRVHLKEPDGIGTRELANRSTVKYDVVRACIGKWTKWRYIKRHKESWPYAYSILQKGINFLAKLPPEQIEELIEEIKYKRNLASSQE